MSGGSTLGKDECACFCVCVCVCVCVCLVCVVCVLSCPSFNLLFGMIFRKLNQIMNPNRIFPVSRKQSMKAS